MPLGGGLGRTERLNGGLGTFLLGGGDTTQEYDDEENELELVLEDGRIGRFFRLRAGGGKAPPSGGSPPPTTSTGGTAAAGCCTTGGAETATGGASGGWTSPQELLEPDPRPHHLAAKVGTFLQKEASERRFKHGSEPTSARTSK